jgi:hypothetical protein
MGVAVHAALARWQRSVDGGATPKADALLELARQEAARRGVALEETGRAWERARDGLRAYVAGPWPRRATLFLEQPARHVLRGPDGFAVELHLRVDRVARYRRGVAILDFKVVTPHAFELRVDQWQLRTYALAAPELLGIASSAVHLFVVDLAAAEDRPVGAAVEALEAAAGELLDNARGIAAGRFEVAVGHEDRPCWSCGFRLSCPASSAPRRI